MNSLGIDLLGKDVVIAEKFLAPQWRHIKFRLFHVTGGFGASPVTMGTALCGEHLYDGEKVRWEGPQVERLATEDEVQEVRRLREDAEMTELF